MSATREYIANFGQKMINATRFTRLLPSVMMAQGILESRNGQSTLASKYNNHFGIKANKSWKGKTVNMRTGEVFGGQSVMINDNFRAYDTLLQGFKDRVDFLFENKRYADVFKFNSAEEQAQELKDAGYATDPNYAQKLIKIINDFDLKSLDRKQKSQNALIFALIVATFAFGFWIFYRKRNKL